MENNQNNTSCQKAGSIVTTRMLRNVVKSEFSDYKITGGDGVTRDMLQIPGEYGGRQGNFEFIKDPDGSINHR